MIHPGKQFAQVSCSFSHLAGPLAGLPILQGSRGHIQGSCQLPLAQSEPLPRLEEGEVIASISVAPSASRDVPHFQELSQM